MGKVTGFLEIDRQERKYAPAADRIRHYQEFVIPAIRGSHPQSGGPLHELRHPLLSHRMPRQQPDPRLERSRLPRTLAGSRARPAFDQQFSGVHRPHLPGSLRSRLHAQHRGGAGNDQDHRMRDRRSGLAGRLGTAGAGFGEDRQKSCRRRLRPGGPRRSPATRARRTCGPRIRETPQARRPAALRHSRLQDGKAPDRPAGAAARGGRRQFSLRNPYRRHPGCQAACRQL